MELVTETSEDLTNYLAKADKLVQEYQVRNRNDEILKQINSIKKEAKVLDDSFNLHKAWKCNMSVQLHEIYNHRILLELHGSNEGQIIQNGEIYTILENNRVKIQFLICIHATYTPILKDGSYDNQCLKC